uniref:Uncharacterized protein n=1 Tax=Rhizophagus irregularis (strain DAOM 181602 / DAOM 197198 / MUCL 43194) TaxID=747089 RepID=U9T2E7_RHIID
MDIYYTVRPFKPLFQVDVKDLFEKIAQDTDIKIDLSKYIEKYLQDLLNKDIKSVFLKVKNPFSKNT